MHEICTVIDKVPIYNKKNDTVSGFPVILATERKMQTDTCTVCRRTYPSLVLFSPHTPPEHLHQPTRDGQAEREGSSLKPNTRSCCPRPWGKGGTSGRKMVEIYSRERSSSIDRNLRWEQERQCHRKAREG